MEKQLLKLTLAGALLVSLISCGKAQEEKGPKDGFDGYTKVSGNCSVTDDYIEGTCSLRFLRTSPQAKADQAYHLKAVLNYNGSSITLVAFASSPALTDGVQVRFERSGNNVLAHIRVNNSAYSQVLPVRLVNAYPGNLSLIVEVHNDPSGTTRVLFWPGGIDAPAAANAMFDSQYSGQLNTPLPSGGGNGVFWGLQLDRTTGNQGRFAEAYVQ